MMSYSDGLKWLALSHGDARELRRAARFFVRTQDWDRAKRVLHIAEQLGDVRCVKLLNEAGRRHGVVGLQSRNFAEWFRYHGVRWFDIYSDAADKKLFVSLNDLNLLHRLVRDNFPEPKIFWDVVEESATADNTYPKHRLALLRKIARGRPPVIDDRTVDATDEAFREHCLKHDITILRKLQDGERGTGLCSHVWLAQDSDGLMKVFKEIVPREQPPLNCLQVSEELTLQKLRKRTSAEVPRCYGTTELHNGRPSFLRISTVYGQTLDEMLDSGPLEPTEVRSVVRQLAANLSELHAIGLIYRDLRPQNAKIKNGRLTLLDVGDAVGYPTPGHLPGEPVFVPMADAKFAPPEVTLRYQALPESDVFQLGVLLHLLATGEHPFYRESSEHFDDERDREIAEYAWPMANAAYDSSDLRAVSPELADLAERLLVPEPTDRPSARKIADELGAAAATATIRHRPRRNPTSQLKRNTVLFPARMGIPHRGHIDYLARLLELDFDLIISLQNSYCITTFDPLPKWIVMKMVAQSLLDLGFSSERFRFLLTPTYETLRERRLHFGMMPGRADVIAVASGNPEVWEIFPKLPVLDQAAVFGHENQEHETRSWGALLRRAVRDGDYEMFSEYAASGAETIMPFDELRARYAETPTDFVEGRIYACLIDGDGGPLTTARVTRYETPESALIRVLNAMGRSARLVDPFARYSVIELEGQRRLVRYERTRLVGDDARIDFLLI